MIESILYFQKIIVLNAYYRLSILVNLSSELIDLKQTQNSSWKI